GSPITRICQVVVASVRKHNLVVPEDSSLLYEMPDKKSGVESSRKLMHHDDLSLHYLSAFDAEGSIYFNADG
ncbi:hypothetical protein TSUD_82910, partial [Trifolium subterraneum]